MNTVFVNSICTVVFPFISSLFIEFSKKTFCFLHISWINLKNTVINLNDNLGNNMAESMLILAVWKWVVYWLNIFCYHSVSVVVATGFTVINKRFIKRLSLVTQQSAC